MVKGCIFSIEEFSVYDGPGIRSTVFLKGCPLSCEWCHNPEGQDAGIQIVKSPNGCVGCGACFENAVQENGKTVFMERSIKKCPMKLLRYCGKMTESTELCSKLLANREFLSDGGVTFSGGEPFFQSGFLFECLEQLKGKMHTAIQTSGFCESAVFARATELADHFLFDLKLFDEAQHIKYTGVSNRLILENFRFLAKSGKDLTVRIPLIPGVTDTYENIDGLCRLMSESGIYYAELMPYNKMAGGKYKLLGKTYSPSFDETLTPDIQADIFEKYCIKILVL